MSKVPRSSRTALHATPQQEIVLRRAAKIAHQSMADFILDSACQAAEQTLLNQRWFVARGSQSVELLSLLERTEQDNLAAR